MDSNAFINQVIKYIQNIKLKFKVVKIKKYKLKILPYFCLRTMDLFF